MREAYGPDYKSVFTLAGLPEAVVSKVRQVVGTSRFRDPQKTGYYDRLLEPGRKAVMERLQQAGTGDKETAERWENVRAWLQGSPAEPRDWRQLVTLMARLHDPNAPDPVDSLEDFLQLKVFRVEVQRLLLEIPDRLKLRPVANGVLKIYQAPPGSPSRVALTLEPVGDGQAAASSGVWIYTIRPKGGQRMEFEPGNSVWADLPLRDEQQLTWLRSRSARYDIEYLRRPPKLHRANEAASRGRLEEDIHLIPEPPDGIPIVPDLMLVVDVR